MRLRDQPLSPPAQVLATASTCSKCSPSWIISAAVSPRCRVTCYSRAPKASSPRLKGLLWDLAMGGTQSDEHERQLAQVSQVLKSAAFEVDTRLRQETSPPCSAGMPSR
ncbi:hypothetical protein D3C86_1879760 [compost metagenome]